MTSFELIKIPHILQRMVTGCALSSLFLCLFAYLPPAWLSLVLLSIMLYIIFFEWTNFFDSKQPIFWALIPFYIVLPFTLLIILNHTAEHRSLLLMLFIVVSSFDTGSYLAGILCGTTHIAPSISPKKTWEGAFGGYLAACTGLLGITWKLTVYQPWWLIMLFSLVVCALSLAGDLFESYLKRYACIKDSGSILPGHGGFLDRFDGILFAVFFFFIFRHTLATLFFSMPS